ncbi:MAG TPA: bifunctional 5,10-methylene-tetrahydrofolate dehydrogenase/5,10-methylene-tetrahydrofolate cyclohydrolase [Acidimicrobiaceae bacterium]|jgi:methylenetetrahydrofolate dehydrogenase (NADP+)/methenyltetrahydrofolate cyclohydrolase|nr:bifunctional 5,10-methylene-tetrahydrofolate dehydrogenase/5,10-methylene-tetrahydrofolate cyclohydrolase [Acidimicrobiaceae bacterium]
MTAQLLDGQLVANLVLAELSERTALLSATGVTAGMGTILVGDDAPSRRYVAMKHRDAEALGIYSRDVRLPATATQEEVMESVQSLNEDPEVHAFILQYPFPAHLDYSAALGAVIPAKDADGLHPFNLGCLVMGEPAPVACTPAGIVRLLDHFGINVAGKHVVIVGRGLTIGRPLANLLTLKQPGCNAAVTVVHTGVADLGGLTRTADVIVAAAGCPDLITAEMVSPGATVVAAGVSFREGSLRSDVAAEVEEVAGWLSPTIGGVGPMTRSMLLSNCVAAAEAATSRDASTSAGVSA